MGIPAYVFWLSFSEFCGHVGLWVMVNIRSDYILTTLDLWLWKLFYWWPHATKGNMLGLAFARIRGLILFVARIKRKIHKNTFIIRCFKLGCRLKYQTYVCMWILRINLSHGEIDSAVWMTAWICFRFVCLFFCLFVCLSVCLSVCLFVCLFNRKTTCTSGNYKENRTARQKQCTYCCRTHQ